MYDRLPARSIKLNLGATQTNYMGIDHHKQYSHITMLNEKGKKLKPGRVANFRSELERFLDCNGEVKAVIEAGRSSYTMVDILDELSIDVTIAHPKADWPSLKADFDMRCFYNKLKKR